MCNSAARSMTMVYPAKNSLSPSILSGSDDIKSQRYLTFKVKILDKFRLLTKN